MKKLFQLSFLPRSVDCALLLLRVWFGLSMLLNHGWGKLMNFSGTATKAPDPLHIGGLASWILLVFAEVICAALLVLGLGTRFAALVIAIDMAVAFTMAHHMKFSNPGSGELAFLYLGAALVILFAGSGKYAVDGA